MKQSTRTLHGHNCDMTLAIVSSLIIIFLPAFVIYNAFGRDATSALKEIQLPSATNGKLHLSSVATASFTKSDDVIEADLSFSGHSIHETFRRAITFYVIEGEPDCLLIDEAHDSNEDTLHAYELRSGRLNRLTISHSSDDDYIHQHFKVLTASGRSIRCIENEYAGSNSPRKRTLTIQFSSSRLTCKRTKWTKAPGDGASPKAMTADRLIANASASEFGDSGYGCVDTIAVAASKGVDYRRVVDGAMRRDPGSLRELFWLTAHAGFDGASSEGNAAVLGNLLRYLGDGTFGSALSTEPAEIRKAVQDELRYDFGLEESGGKDAWLVEWYPLTFGSSPRK